ncbi:hypothetical protein [Salinibacillus aidingensis]|uniref:hypothetical protein n=1 Tax=Salinibacillus aidingensis TaxID=237684 RepID=UPI0031CEC1A0
MKGIYIAKKSIQSLMVEWVGNKLKMIYFDHGWNFGWSMMIYAKMYTFSLLILRRPLLTTILSIFTTICFLLTFNVPIPIQIKLRQFMKRLLRFYKVNRQFVLAVLTVIMTLLALVRGRRKMNIFFWILYTIGRMFFLPVYTEKVAWKQ